MELYVVRHGQTDWNVESRIQGHTNTSLNETGRKQADELSKKIESVKLDLIISSPLTRALDTAKAINQNRNLSIIINNDLIERSFGDFEGLDDLSSYNCDINTLLDYKLNYDKNNVEPIQDLFKRVSKFIKFCSTNFSNKNILVSTHGGVVQALECILKKMPLDTNLQTLSLKNCDYRRYVIEKEITLDIEIE